MIQLSRTPRWFCAVGSDNDPDDEMENEMNQIEERYGQKIIYESNAENNGNWTITSYSKIQYYKNEIEHNLGIKIGVDNVQKIFKYIYCEERI